MKIRETAPGDIAQAMAIMNRNASPEKTLDFMKWWNFGLFPSVTFVAEDRETIVGMFIVFKRKLVNGLGCGVLMGLVVDPDQRGTGLFGDIGRRAMSHCEDMDLFVCLTNKRGRKALEGHFGFRTIETIETMVLSHDLADSDCGKSGVLEKITPETSFDRARPFSPDVLAFEADETFRRWRFGLRPDTAPYFMTKNASGESLIVKTYYHEEKGMRYGDIVDFRLRNFGPTGLSRIVDVARATLGPDAEAITMQAVHGSEFYEMLTGIGFVESDMRHFFCMKVKDRRNAHLYDPAPWLVTWGDFLR